MEAFEDFYLKYRHIILLLVFLIVMTYILWVFLERRKIRERRKIHESSFEGDVYGGGAPRDIL